jgi:PAS domain S-box-containing protein
MPFAYVRLDPEFRVIDWNAGATHIFGYAQEEVLGMGPPFERILPCDAAPHVHGLLGRLRRSEQSTHSVNDNLTKDGRTITCEWFNAPLFTDDGQFAGVSSIILAGVAVLTLMSLREWAEQPVSAGMQTRLLQEYAVWEALHRQELACPACSVSDTSRKTVMRGRVRCSARLGDVTSWRPLVHS